MSKVENSSIQTSKMNLRKYYIFLLTVRYPEFTLESDRFMPEKVLDHANLLGEYIENASSDFLLNRI